jgi:hypothetical protein
MLAIRWFDVRCAICDMRYTLALAAGLEAVSSVSLNFRESLYPWYPAEIAVEQLPSYPETGLFASAVTPWLDSSR